MTTISPTDVEFYAGHTDEQLEACIAKFGADGAFIAANSGADHPLAVECARSWAAAVLASETRR